MRLLHSSMALVSCPLRVLSAASEGGWHWAWLVVPFLVTWLWGSGGVGRVPAGGARSLRGPAPARCARAAAHPLRRPRWYHPASHREWDPTDDARGRRQPPARRSPLPATPAAPPR